MNIEFTNCNSIDNGKIEIVENKLNIFYAINGTGKSTIAKSIATHNNEDDFLKLMPFKYVNEKTLAIKPTITGIENIQTVKVFDENYVTQYLFKNNELIKNSFDIFVKTPDYENQYEAIENLIIDTRNVFSQDEELEKLVSDFTLFIEGFGKAKSGYSASGAIGKAFGNGNKCYNVPEQLEPFTEYIQTSENGLNVKWLKWHLTGKDFLNLSHKCPYCTTKTDDTTKTTILNVSKEFDANSISHLNKLLEIFDNLMNYFADSTKIKISEISTNIAGISDEQKNYLLEVKIQVSTLLDKFNKISFLNFFTLKDTYKDLDKLREEINSCKIDLSFLSHLDSDYTASKTAPLNNAIDKILTNIIELKKAVGKQNALVEKIIREKSNEINSFLEYAGYNYKIEISEDVEEQYKLKLCPVNLDYTISQADFHLSYGERNAFALVLFMYETLNLNPDLIILDDPISSFDGNKKYAILYKLFKSRNSFRDKTVILLTHEFGTIIDTIYNMTGQIPAVAKHLENKNGQLIEKIITKDKILSFKMIALKNINEASNKVIKLIYLRRLLEVEDCKDEAWELLSNFFKENRDIPIYKLDDGTSRRMGKREINKATKLIREYIQDFNYKIDYEALKDKVNLVNLYFSSYSNYEKLQLYRIINNDNSEIAVFKKFVNETFHIENDYLFQLNPLEFEVVPHYVITACDSDIKKIYPTIVLQDNDCMIEDSNSSSFATTEVTRKLIKLYEIPASAGAGHFIDDCSYTKILIDDIDCDYATYISGDSMEPTIPNESIVLIKLDYSVTNNYIGIFNLNNEIFCKRLENNKLVSLNDKYPSIEISEFDVCKFQGKVVKVIRPEDIETTVEYLHG